MVFLVSVIKIAPFLTSQPGLTFEPLENWYLNPSASLTEISAVSLSHKLSLGRVRLKCCQVVSITTPLALIRAKPTTSFSTGKK